MNTHKEKLSLLIELVEFSIVDGHLHQREYDFIAIVANELKIEKSVFESLFHKEIKPTVLKSEFQRIQQFYRLALLMHIDGILHEKEENSIKQIAINMGLNPIVTKRVLLMIKVSPTVTIDAEYLLEAFKEQHN